jgi:hypothetical protein
MKAPIFDIIFPTQQAFEDAFRDAAPTITPEFATILQSSNPPTFEQLKDAAIEPSDDT